MIQIVQAFARRRGSSPGTRVARRWLAACLAAWLVLMLPLAFWGLPTARVDPLLFGGEPSWPAQRYAIEPVLQDRQLRTGGADTDRNPVASHGEIVELTDDAGRAEILRRYRLFSRQPDEVITFMALQRMRPRELDFDPRLYQYGGAYIYLVGATLGAASFIGFIDLRSDAGVYLERPEQFARFYVAARFISLFFGLLALLAAYRLGSRLRGPPAGFLAVLLVAATPAFFTAALEAKPHLASTCLVLWALLAGARFRRNPSFGRAARLGALCGLAFGFVLTGLVSFALLPLLLWRQMGDAIERRRRLRGLLLAALVAVGVYALTNPYVLYNLMFRPEAIQSNLGNSLAMYSGQAGKAMLGVIRVSELLWQGGGVAAVLGLIGTVVVLIRDRRREGIPAVALGAAVLVMGALLGAGKPAEFARFLLLPIVLLCVAASALLAAMFQRSKLLVFLGVMAGLLFAPGYIYSFAADASFLYESRYAAGQYLAHALEPGESIGVLQEPAPYAAPPLDFAHRRIVLLPDQRPAGLDLAALPEWLVFTADGPEAHARAWWREEYVLVCVFPELPPRSPIAWANKPVFIFRINADHP